MRNINRFSLLKSLRNMLLKSAPLVFSSVVLETQSDISAVILEIQEVKDDNIHGILGEIMIESDTIHVKSKTKVAIREKTIIVARDDQGFRQVDYSELRTRQKINIWFPDKDHVKSYGSGVAQQIEIIFE